MKQCKHDRVVTCYENSLLCLRCDMTFKPQDLVDALVFYADKNSWYLPLPREGWVASVDSRDIDLKTKYAGVFARRALGMEK